MNEQGSTTATVRRRSVWPWLVFGALIVSALAVRLWSPSNRPQLPIIGDVPAFDLVDQHGQSYGAKDLANKVWIASFIYTTCPGPCPRVVERMAHVKAQLGDQPDLMLVSFSVDPQADTPDVLDAYARLRNIDPQRWRLLTGPVDAVISLIRQGFMLALQRSDTPDRERLATDGPVIHSTRLVLVDRRSRIRGYYETNDADDMARLVTDTRDLLRNKPL